MAGSRRFKKGSANLFVRISRLAETGVGGNREDKFLDLFFYVALN
jgi:hypothetical protein